MSYERAFKPVRRLVAALNSHHMHIISSFHDSDRFTTYRLGYSIQKDQTISVMYIK